MSLKFSIITPSYNHGRFIRNTIESVLNQNYENFEHIIIDDGSKDNTISILKEYPHLNWLTQKNEGPAKAVNKGFQMATGDIFCWINSDDYFDDNIFSEIENLFLSQHNLELIIGNITVVDIYNNIISRDKTYPFDINYLLNVSADVIRQPPSFYTKKIVRKVKGLDETLDLAFDYDLFLKMLHYTRPLFIDKNLAYYRDYPTTLSRSRVRKQSLEIFCISRKYGGRLISKLNKTNLKKFIFKPKI